MRTKRKKTKTIAAVMALMAVLAMGAVMHSDFSDAGYTDSAVTIYKSPLDKGYYLSGGETVSSVPFANKAFTSLKVMSNKDICPHSTSGGITTYAVYGTKVSIVLSFNIGNGDFKNGWHLSDDNYKSVSGQYVGPVGSGAILVQKWTPSGWTTIMHNPDAYDAVGGKDIVYTPSLEDLQSGTKYRVMYAYEVYKPGFFDWLFNAGREYSNYVEYYTFTLAVDDTASVTFKNLTASANYTDDTDGTIYRSLESMRDGSMTVTGFKVDKHLNGKMNVCVQRNGQTVASNAYDGQKFDVSGRYDVTVTSVLGSEARYTFFVDRDGSQRFDRIFGDDYLQGNRIYDPDSDIPVYVAGTTTFKVKVVPSSTAQTNGKICKDGTVLSSFTSRNGMTVSIGEPGTYTSTVTVGRSDSGDQVTYVIAFKAISSDDVPGPQVNRNMLSSLMYPTDFSTSYWGVTLDCESGGSVELMFASKERAEEGAYLIQNERVRETEGGFIWNDVTYHDRMDLTSAINCWVSSHVQKGFLDVRDPARYQCYLGQYEDITADSAHKVVMFGSELDRELLHSEVPIISQKPYRFIDGDYVNDGNDDIVFTRDPLGLDSASVTMTDCNGMTYHIAYGVPLMTQLIGMHVPAGKVVFHETTYCGYECSYEAIYLGETNTASLGMTYNLDGSLQNLTSTNAAGHHLMAQYLEITALADELGDSFITIVKDGDVEHARYLSSEDISDEHPTLVLKGVYTITVVNRAGASFSVEVQVVSLYDAIINLGGQILYAIQGQVATIPDAAPGYRWCLEDGTSVGSELSVTNSNMSLISVPLVSTPDSVEPVEESDTITEASPVTNNTVALITLVIAGVLSVALVWRRIHG